MFNQKGCDRKRNGHKTADANQAADPIPGGFMIDADRHEAPNSIGRATGGPGAGLDNRWTAAQDSARGFRHCEPRGLCCGTVTCIHGDQGIVAHYWLPDGMGAGDYGFAGSQAGVSMIILGWTSAVLTAGGKRRRSRVQPVGRAGTIGRLVHLLFYKPLGVTGTIGRIGLLGVGAVASYFVGSGLGELMLKAPVPMALMFGAALLALEKDSGQP